jgi:hypothetical protein
VRISPDDSPVRSAAQETRSHSPSLDGFFRRENGGRNLKGDYFEQLQEVATARQLDYTIPGLA